MTTTHRLAEQLQTLDTDLIVAVLAGQIDLQRLLREQLVNRGLDQAGKWVGFDAARVAQVKG